MAATPPTSLCLSLSLDSALQPILLHSSHHPSLPTTTTTSTTTSHPFFYLHRPHPPTNTTSTTHPFFSLHKPHTFHHGCFHHFSPLPSPFAANSSVDSPPRAGPFLDAAGLARLQALDKFYYSHEFDHGWLEIRPMEAEELDPTVQLLAESFVESMWTPPRYVNLLAFLVKQYVMERRLLVPHTAVLVGYYKGKDKDGGDAQLACTAEVSFDALGANTSPPTPPPPKDCPYVCNITVKKALRRMGIGWELLKACEELISQMKTSRKVYLHCRVVDTGPLRMYKKAGYDVVKKDSILIWLTLQRRKYLMLKELLYSNDDHSATYDLDDEQIR